MCRNSNPVAQQPLQTGAVVGVDANGRIEREPTAVFPLAPKRCTNVTPPNRASVGATGAGLPQLHLDSPQQHAQDPPGQVCVAVDEDPQSSG